MNDSIHARLTFFRSDSGVTISFGDRTYFIDKAEPFYNIALKAIDQNDYIPFYVEVARREGKGEEFTEALLREVDKILPEET